MAVTTKTLLRALYQAPEIQLGISTLLASHRGKIFSDWEIVASLYDDAEDGGPDGARPGLRTAVLRLRRAGVPIINHHNRGYSIAPRSL
jgi:DNA-binding response OmpR family regulator